MSRKLSGANLTAFHSTAPEVILSGPANSGKTFALLVKIHRYCTAHPKVKVLMLRKTRVSLNESALLTWESEVYPRALLRHNYVQRGSRREYRYPNGSRVVVAGLDNPEKLLSARYDMIYVNECSELSEEFWAMAGSRLLATKGPYRQLLGDCNPPREGKEHWIWKRHELGDCELLFSEHRLNPAMTADALRRLESLRGDLKRRFFEGSWDAMPQGSLFKAEHFKYLEASPLIRTAIRTTFERGFGSGTDMTQSILSALSGYSVWAIKPKGNKAARADPFAAQVEAGNVYLVRGDWNAAFVLECCQFTGEEKPGEHDDQVDAASGAFNQAMQSKHGDRWRRHWDIAAGTSESADRTAGVLLGVLDDGRIIISDVAKGRWGPHERNEQMRLIAERDRQAVRN